MDRRPDIDREIVEVEYVEAEPIEGSGAPPMEQPAPYVRTYYSGGGGCVPCCGPFGCIIFLLIISYMFFEFEIVRAIAFGLMIFIVVSILAGSLARGRR